MSNETAKGISLAVLVVLFVICTVFFESLILTVTWMSLPMSALLAGAQWCVFFFERRIVRENAQIVRLEDMSYRRVQPTGKHEMFYLILIPIIFLMNVIRVVIVLT